jgi:PAS domain S-box-containing protein
MVDLARSQDQVQNPLQHKNVLILNAFESNIPAFQNTNRGLSAALQAGGIGIRNQFYEHLDLVRNPGPENKKLLVELMRRRYSGRRIDFIITLYPESLKFLLDEGRTIFPDVPVLALFLPQGFELPETERRIIRHLVIPDFTRTLENALKLIPKIKHVYVAGGTHPVDRWLESLARQDFKKWEGRLEFHYLSELPLDKIMTTVSAAPPDSIVLITTFGQDVTGKYQTTVEIGQQIARVSTAPVFGFLDTLLGHGIVGGSLLSFEYIGTRAAEMVLDILRGTQYRKDLPIELEVPQLDTFDWRQLRHWNLKESALPKGSIIVNREFSLWDLKYYAIGVLVFMLAQSFLIIALLVQKRRRKLAEISLRQKSKELDQFFNVSLDLLCIANTDGYFLRLNPVWESILGYSKEELVAQQFLDFVHPDDLVRTQGAISTLASQGKVIHFDNRYRCKDGSYRWLDWASAPVGNLIFAVARDVTKRKHAEEALQERLQFEQLLSDVSARFVNIPPDRVDSEIECGLKQILEFFQVDRAGLVRTVPGKSAYQLTHVAYGEDVAPIPSGVELPISINPWAYEKLILKREVVAFSRLDDLPPEASVDKQTWKEWGIQSNVNIPILVGEPVDHIISINSVKREQVWQEGLFSRLQILGEIFVSALERRQAEEASRESERILRQNENDLRKLAGKLIYAQEEERSRLARELHDDLAQRLAVFAIDVGRLQQQLVDPPVPVQEELCEMKKDIVKISQDVHNLSRQLHPSILDDLGLIKAVESECNNFSRREGIEIVFNHEKIPTVIPKDISLSLYRIIQEALSNISKHACADHISVSLKHIGHDVFLSVQDDGIGFDSAEVKEKPGLGFSSMRERASLMHGEFSISSHPERGTVIAVRVPLARKGE